MSNDFENKLAQVAGLLSQGDVAENIKGLLSNLGSSNNRPAENSGPAEESRSPQNQLIDMRDSGHLVREIQNIVERIKPYDDPRINLIKAIKPFVEPKRQQHIEHLLNAISISRMINIMWKHQ